MQRRGESNCECGDLEPDIQGRDSGASRRDFVRAMAASAIAGTVLGLAETALPSPPMNRFAFHASQSALNDLKRRLSSTRWPERETVADWSQGVPEARLRSWVEYWQTGYDWRRCEARLNDVDQFRMRLDGLRIHFLHARSRHADALPLIISHGWPGSILDYLDVIGPLTDPAAHGGAASDAFHVVVPSLPGFAFSDKPRSGGWNTQRIADAWIALMARLGYRDYVAQGGDWGAFITTAMAQRRPAGLRAIHLNFPQVIPDRVPSNLSDEERRAVEAIALFHKHHDGYFVEQATRPQTIGYLLADSPVGCAAWIFDIFRYATDNNGDPEQALTRDKMLDEITLYWLTNSAASSARLYYEQQALGLGNHAAVVDLPVGCSIFPREIYRAPRSWAQRLYPHLFYWNELDRGGHFAALEQPALFVQEMRNCFRPLRER